MNWLRVVIGTALFAGAAVNVVGGNYSELLWIACTALYWRTACSYEDQLKELRGRK